MAEGRSQAALWTVVQAYLAKRRSLTLAAGGTKGPWAAGLYFASDGLNLYFLSDPATFRWPTARCSSSSAWA